MYRYTVYKYIVCPMLEYAVLFDILTIPRTLIPWNLHNVGLLVGQPTASGMLYLIVGAFILFILMLYRTTINTITSLHD